LKAARVQIYVRRGGPNYQKGLAKMRELGTEIGIPIEVSRCRGNSPFLSRTAFYHLPKASTHSS
jgi:succinyl-CoA synthetase beta subunit